jgi:hypothetical protein
MPPKLPSRSPRVPLLATALAIGGLLASCGGTFPPPATVTTGGTTNAESRSATSGATSSRSTASGTGVPSALAFAKCMRANGVPNFPDPTAGGGGLFSMAGLNPAAPAFEAAQTKCHTLLPGGGLPGPGTQTHPSAQTVAKLLNIARCMRQHGVSQFPDPRTSVPSNFSPVMYTGLTDFDGAILAWPSTINFHAPAYTQAAAACGPLAQKIGLGHPH